MSAFTWPPESAAGTTGQRPDPRDRAVAARSPADRSKGEQQIQAAVLVPLFLAAEAGEPHLVLTRRRADLRSHAGEISFPGGRRDAEDADLSATALREAEEEIGLARAHVRMLGELPPTSTFVTNYVIHPFVASIPAALQWRPSAREVDAVLELPLAALRSGRTRTRMERRGITFETDTFVVEEHLIWGATARIIENLLERLQTADSDGQLSLA